MFFRAIFFFVRHVRYVFVLNGSSICFAVFNLFEVVFALAAWFTVFAQPHFRLSYVDLILILFSLCVPLFLVGIFTSSCFFALLDKNSMPEVVNWFVCPSDSLLKHTQNARTREFNRSWTRIVPRLAEQYNSNNKTKPKL